jgi:transposase
MLRPHMFNQVRKLSAQGKSQAAIARELKLDPKTVASYLRKNTPPRYTPRTRSTRVDPFLGFEEKVHAWLARTPTLSDQEIFEFLLIEGYTGSERTINRRMKRLRDEKPKERFFEQNYTPGEQAQFDFKECVELPFIDGVRVTHLHFGTLPYSDVAWIRGYPFRNFECFMDGIHCFFEKIGGRTDKIRFDNLAPCVKKVLEGSNRLYTDAFERATTYYDWGLLPCAPAKGSDKGDVERDIRSYAIRIKNLVSHEAIVFRDWEHLNEWLDEFMGRHHTEEIRARFQVEQPKLKVLARRDESILCQIQIGPASAYGSIRIGKSAYSVPDSMIGLGCKSVIGAYDIRISRVGSPASSPGEKPIIHPRKIDGEHSLRLEHILPSLVRKPHALVRWAHREILFPEKVCEQFYERLQRIHGYGAEREYLRAVNLVHHIEFAEILIGMQLVLETPSLQLFDDLRSLLLAERRPAPVVDITSRFHQVPLQPELSHYDQLIPKEGQSP